MTKDFIPKSLLNVVFHIKNFSYELSKEDENDDLLIETLRREALYKKEIYDKQLKREESLNTSNISDSSYSKDSESEIYTSNTFSESNLNSSIHKKITKNKILELKRAVTQNNKRKRSFSKGESNILVSKTMKFNKINKKNEISNNHSNYTSNNNSNSNSNYNSKIKNTKIQEKEKKNFFKSFHKVNLNNIYLLIYDFNKEMIIEKNEKEYKTKIEEILNNIKKKKSIDIGRDEDFPFYSYKNIKYSIKDKNKNKKINEKRNEKNDGHYQVIY